MNMEINFNNIENLNECWENFMDKIWTCSNLIKIAYSPSVGRIIIELSSEIKDEYTLIKKHYIKLDSIIDENTLFNAVKNIFIKDIYNKISNIKNFRKFNINTLNSRLDRLTKRGLILKKDISGKLKPGGDKKEYKLTKAGEDRKNELITKAMEIIITDPSIKKILLKQALLEEDNIISNIISEYSKE